jgi:hypothetical protein
VLQGPPGVPPAQPTEAARCEGRGEGPRGAEVGGWVGSGCHANASLLTTLASMYACTLLIAPLNGGVLRQAPTRSAEAAVLGGPMEWEPLLVAVGCHHLLIGGGGEGGQEHTLALLPSPLAPAPVAAALADCAAYVLQKVGRGWVVCRPGASTTLDTCVCCGRCCTLRGRNTSVGGLAGSLSWRPWGWPWWRRC